LSIISGSTSIGVNSSPDWVSAPADYADLHQRYFRFVVNLVRRAGIPSNSCEDVASAIMLRFMEKDYLGMFDPTLVFEYGGTARPARFKQFLQRIVLYYVRGMRDKERTRAEREPLLCDQRVGENQEDTWLEVYGGVEDSFEGRLTDDVAEDDVIETLRHYLGAVPRRSRFDTCCLLTLFDAVVEQVHVNGEININQLARDFETSVATMHANVWWLRENLAAALNRPVPPKRHQLRIVEPGTEPEQADDDQEPSLAELLAAA
jgi:hypothetical protein